MLCIYYPLDLTKISFKYAPINAYPWKSNDKFPWNIYGDTDIAIGSLYYSYLKIRIIVIQCYLNMM